MSFDPRQHANARELHDAEGPAYHARTFHIPSWDGWNDGRRIQFLRQAAEAYGRDPRLREFVINEILKNVEGRDYRTQAAAILRWVQQNIKYVNEPGEQLQSPWYTLRVKFSDCDDMALLLASFYQAVRLPWKYVLSGVYQGRKVRWTEGQRMPAAKWAHIYVAVGWPPFVPKEWAWAEPTVKAAPLGWDTIDGAAGSSSLLPEMRALGAEDSLLSSFMPSDDFWSSLKKELALHRVVGALVLGFVSAAIAPRIADKVFGQPRKKR